MTAALPSLSVVFSTYNRADLLSKTLSHMQSLDRAGLDVEFVVINNNSRDHTGDVLRTFESSMPLAPLFESRQGKNAALNHALETHPVKEIVVFTDDDIIPREDWLQRIAAGAARHPDYDVFGGKIEPIWPPDVEIPRWALTQEDMRIMALALHDQGPTDNAYVDRVPLGPNYWVRRTLFDGGRRFDPTIGPRPGSYRMGSESSFLLEVVADGYTPMYVHDAIVGHFVQPVLLTDDGLVSRFVKSGRGILPKVGVNRPDLLQRSRPLWTLRTCLALTKSGVGLAAARLARDDLVRARKLSRYARDLGYDLESLREVYGPKES